LPKYIYRDLVCTACGTESLNQMVTGFTLPVLHPCQKCTVDTLHHDSGTNTGGANKRYRFQDFSTNPKDYREGIKTRNFKADVINEDGSTEPVVDTQTGQDMDKNPRYSEESRKDRIDRAHHEIDKKRG